MSDKLYVSESELNQNTNTVMATKVGVAGDIEYTRTPQWMPIESAPDQLTEVLALACTGRVTIEYCRLLLANLNSDSSLLSNYFTHWMPLPLPPK